MGKGYSKISAIAIKGEYCKEFDTTPEDKYKTVNKMYYHKEITKKKDEARSASVSDQSSGINNMYYFIILYLALSLRSLGSRQWATPGTNLSFKNQ